ncbi:MAG: DUF2892 domain-containing protein [Candidatus Omnitrophica bacterium CG07_land_8_20_14_0_80_42_15]|uniref:DUF2892 domain-containing protein n=1 Tax=Candidatus Aquitaenariimonas noxiae TaxID=1974741 RepID=A0A2J0KVR5_9BACT|nr:MAG: DUF2892 domain-containing protein [Candidatus Omnitrophica bacterium CG07_land_8_20_14_0_80_42_15]
MEKNVGSVDKVARVLMGTLIIICGIYFKSLWGLVGIVPIVTGFIGYCPIYQLFGLNTCKK